MARSIASPYLVIGVGRESYVPAVFANASSNPHPDLRSRVAELRGNLRTNCGGGRIVNVRKMLRALREDLSDPDLRG